MATEKPARPKKLNKPTEYIVVADFSAKTLHGPSGYLEALAFAGVIRRGGGKVTIFKSTKA